MKITALAENTCNCGLTAEHGLSLYIETEKHKILFDFGASGVFQKNAEKLGIDIGMADIAFLSHGHYDHGGGLETFLDVNKIANVYMHELVFEPHFNGRNENIGLDPTLDGHPRFIKVREDIRIDSELSFVTLPGRKVPIETGSMKVKRGKYMQKETFEHEMYLQIREGYKNYLISGCSHRGLINLIYAFRFDAFVGGFHFMNYDVLWDEDKLLDAVKAIKNSCADFYTCHCTGSEPYQFLKDEVGAKMNYISTGETIIID